MMTLYFSGVLDNRRNPNQNLSVNPGVDGSRQVTLLRNRQGHYLASGYINGEPVEFLLDTGATFVALSGATAEKLKLNKGAPMATRTAAGIVTSWRATLDRVQLGPIERRSVAAAIVSEMPEGYVLLGMSFLRDLELVQRGDTLVINVSDSNL